MKKITSKIASFLLAIVVLLSTFSFSVDKNYCNGNLVSSTFFGATTCSMNMDKCTMPHTNHCMKKDTNTCHHIQKENCCKNVIKVISNDSREQLTVQKISLKKLHVLAAFITSYTSVFNNYTTNFIPLKNYIPPTIFYDLGVFYQTFRI